MFSTVTAHLQTAHLQPGNDLHCTCRELLPNLLRSFLMNPFSSHERLGTWGRGFYNFSSYFHTHFITYKSEKDKSGTSSCWLLFVCAKQYLISCAATRSRVNPPSSKVIILRPFATESNKLTMTSFTSTPSQMSAPFPWRSDSCSHKHFRFAGLSNTLE